MAQEGLENLLRREESAGDLLAFLFAEDPGPLLEVLGLPAGRYLARPEHRSLRFTDNDGQPVAVLRIGAEAQLQLIGPDRLPLPWRTLRLVDVFGAWVGRPGTGWLAGHVQDVLRSWQQQADGPVGEITSPHGVEVLLHRLAADLLPQQGVYHSATRQLMAWQRPQQANGSAWAAVELRCPRDSTQWLFRPSIDAPGRAPTNDVLTEVHDIAMAVREAMSYTAITAYLVQNGHGELTQYLLPGEHGGFRGSTEEEAASRWHQLALAGTRGRSHPFFFQGGGRRLATQFGLNVRDLDRKQVLALLTSTLQHLSTAMDRVAAPPSDR